MAKLRRSPALVATSILVVAAGVSEARADLHECKDADGNTVFQNEKCLGPIRKPLRDPSESLPDGNPLPAGAPTKTPELLATRSVPAPVPAKKAPPPVVAKRPRARIFPRDIDTLAPAEPVETPAPFDPRLASPERTWQTFATAVRSGDRAAAVACLTSSALAQLGPEAPAFPLEEMRDAVNRIARLTMDAEVEPFRTARGERANGSPARILLEKTANGNWKIAAIRP